MRNLTVNILPLEFLIEKIQVFSSAQEPQGWFIKLLDKKREFYASKNINVTDDYLTLDFSQGTSGFEIDYDLDLVLTKQFINRKIRNYFESKVSDQDIVLGSSFINGVEVYLRSGRYSENEREYIILKQFSLRAEYNKSHKKYGVLISSGRVRYSLAKPLSDHQNDIDSEKINFILYKNRVIRFVDVKDDESFDPQEAYILNSYELSDWFPSRKGVKRVNRYKNYHDEIVEFSKRYLSNVSIDGSFRVESSGFMPILDQDVFRTSRESNLLSFRDEQTSFSAYMGLKQYGPYCVPGNLADIKFFFIFHKDDKDSANKFFSYMSKGYRGFPGFSQFIGIDINFNNLDKTKTIVYSDDANPFEEIKQKLDGFNFDDGRYVAFYLSRINRDEPDEERKKVYFKLKELLLSKSIVSQVIYKDNISNEKFNFFLPNIAVALLAKLAGVPWKLRRPVKNDLIIGIGAERRRDKIYYGNTICFRNDGTFEEFDVFCNDELVPLGESFRAAIEKYVAQRKEVSRLVVHFYKQMSRKEELQLMRILQDINISLPYVVLTITDNPSKDFVFFDESFSGAMPVSGTYVRIRNKMYLLANNDRYDDNAILKMSDYPFPIKIYFSRTRDVDTDNPAVIREIIDQVYQFSRIYWRSVKQKSRPVTILYSEKIAEISSYFNSAELPDNTVAHQRLWFL